MTVAAPSAKAKARLEVLALACSLVAMVVAPAITWAATQAVQAHRIQSLEAALEDINAKLERIAEQGQSVDRRLSYIEGKLGERP